MKPNRNHLRAGGEGRSGQRSAAPPAVRVLASKTYAPLPQPSTRHISGSAIFSDAAWLQINRSLGFSRREIEIVRGIMDDETEGSIAATLGISAHTVHTHVTRLHRKLEVVDRVGLVLRVVSEFLRLTRSPRGGLPPVCCLHGNVRCPLSDR
jgi:DNA-binding CsgD family transcriptional regulator